MIYFLKKKLWLVQMQNINKKILLLLKMIHQNNFSNQYIFIVNFNLISIFITLASRTLIYTYIFNIKYTYITQIYTKYTHILY